MQNDRVCEMPWQCMHISLYMSATMSMFWRKNKRFRNIMDNIPIYIHPSFDSSVGRAEDCSWQLMQISLGRWFDSGSKEFFFYYKLQKLTI